MERHRLEIASMRGEIKGQNDQNIWITYTVRWVIPFLIAEKNGVSVSG